MTFPDIRADRRFKDKLTSDQLTRGTFIQVGGPEVVEICGAVDLDFVILDTEHTPVGWERLSAMCLAALYSGTFPLIRVGTIQQGLVTRALDAGARGVVFPQVQSAEEASTAARSRRLRVFCGPNNQRGRSRSIPPQSAWSESGRRPVLRRGQFRDPAFQTRPSNQRTPRSPAG